MAGKGRGGAAFTFNIDALGIGRGSMPEARVGPEPLYPPTDFKPVPLKVGEDEDYMLALKQEMRGTMQRKPLIKFQTNKADVEKYTQRYLKQIHDDEWTPDWNVFPKELMPQKKTRVKTAPKKKRVKISSKDAEDVLTKLNVLEKKDGDDKSDEEQPKNKENEEDEEEIEEEEYEEEEVEDNDYIDSYFDNGEDFAAGSDDNMDGEATY
ncbi:DNA-directed RNA polymerase III subunit RPC7 [Syngnathoides biaculeatus]|uniref:DNA-directed RNA polymerase III subunit RPC7 n=1 Tax=Syngnathoides biaculeatus TaxID=300417 RepID=UPI002ADD42B7|nr:DNA-directed RNA polymerase III subunit RPC7 [Syngnathoides biaculeatus]XP_061673859.1 DNA-directed RNA polymerase III subunit RPC7 [Syngnathoides biaculeatus]XP_061673860.1 DNA-directed RNA polymerase III subunit RPC7 [Syngnathoides biaculeatus]